jgi:hypothetical protein
MADGIDGASELIENCLDYHLWMGLQTSSLETIKFKSKQASKKGGNQMSKKQVSEEKGKQVSQEEGCPRDAAKRTLEYWIRLGEPLVRMAQRFGHGIMLLLPENPTDKR